MGWRARTRNGRTTTRAAYSSTSAGSADAAGAAIARIARLVRRAHLGRAFCGASAGRCTADPHAPEAARKVVELRSRVAAHGAPLAAVLAHELRPRGAGALRAPRLARQRLREHCDPLGRRERLADPCER